MAFALFPVSFIASEDGRCGTKGKAVNFFTSAHLTHLKSFHPPYTHLKTNSSWNPLSHSGKMQNSFLLPPKISCTKGFSKLLRRREGRSALAWWDSSSFHCSHQWNLLFLGTRSGMGNPHTISKAEDSVQWDSRHWNCHFLLFPQLHARQQRGTSGQESALITYSESGWIFTLSLNSLGNKKPNNSNTWFPDKRLK